MYAFNIILLPSRNIKFYCFDKLNQTKKFLQTNIIAKSNFGYFSINQIHLFYHTNSLTLLNNLFNKFV